MRSEKLSAERLSRKIVDIVPRVSASIERETGANYNDRLIEESIRVCVANAIDRFEDGLLEMFVSPERREFQELTSLLDKRKAPVFGTMSEPAAEPITAGVFAGNLQFSKEKLAAMIEYLTGKGHNVYKTSLNKLLFYADLTYFSLRNQGMSGAVYYNRPFGPVADPAGPVLDELIDAGRIKVLARTQTLEASRQVGPPAYLSNEEIRVLDWVADTYGEMSASGISNLSHEEKAYRFTRPNEPIAYAYAEFLKKLPPKDLI